MKAIVNTAPGCLEWLDWPTPQPGPGQVRVRTAACGICATDLCMIAGWGRTGFPAIPGHEWSGVVDAVGPGGDEELLGTPCVAENVLADGGEVGFEHPGGYAEFLLTEARNIHPLPEGFPLAIGAMIEPLAVCVRAVRRLGLTDRRSALVLGDGPIGLLMLPLLRAEGVEKIALVGGRPARLAAARELGADATLNYHDAGEDLVKAVAGKCGGHFPNVIEASGSPAGAEAALELAAPGGKVLLIGDYGEGRAGFRWNWMLHRELELISSNASAGAWGEAVRLAVGGSVPLERMVSRRLPAASFAEGIDLTRNARDVVKIVMEWPRASCQSITLPARRAHDGVPPTPGVSDAPTRRRFPSRD
jgi:threonine dehydrogenase-like Zn-dependent dehydrogenase